jgi:hypothetical protein
MKRVVIMTAFVVVLAGGYLLYQLGIIDMLRGAGGASNAEACKKVQPLTAPTLAEVYAFSEGLAKAWKADAVLERLDHTVIAPLKPNGSSIEWTVGFLSPAAKSSMLIHTGDGKLACHTFRGEPGPGPALRPDFMRDGAALYALAEKNAGDLLAKGYGVGVTFWATGDRHAMWHLTYRKPDGNQAGVRVVVDANTGAVEEVVKR